MGREGLEAEEEARQKGVGNKFGTRGKRWIQKTTKIPLLGHRKSVQNGKQELRMTNIRKSSTRQGANLDKQITVLLATEELYQERKAISERQEANS